MRSQEKNGRLWKKQGTKPVFWPKLVLSGISPPVLNLPTSTTTQYCSLLTQSLVKIRSCKFSEPIPTFIHIIKLRMKQGLEGQTRAQRQGDFMDNSSVSTQSSWLSLEILADLLLLMFLYMPLMSAMGFAWISLPMVYAFTYCPKLPHYSNFISTQDSLLCTLQLLLANLLLKSWGPFARGIDH
jgi:hypothetical protein